VDLKGKIKLDDVSIVQLCQASEELEIFDTECI